MPGLGEKSERLNRLARIVMAVGIPVLGLVFWGLLVLKGAPQAKAAVGALAITTGLGMFALLVAFIDRVLERRETESNEGSFYARWWTGPMIAVFMFAMLFSISGIAKWLGVPFKGVCRFFWEPGWYHAVLMAPLILSYPVKRWLGRRSDRVRAALADSVQSQIPS